MQIRENEAVTKFSQNIYFVHQVLTIILIEQLKFLSYIFISSATIT